MDKTFRGRRLSLAGSLGLMFFAAGCTQQDTDAFRGIGTKLAAVATDIKDNLGVGWQELYHGVGVETRVAARLHWDKKLAEATIQVQATGSEIELKGSVPTQEQKRRAVELAEATVGVDRVHDSIEVGGR